MHHGSSTASRTHYEAFLKRFSHVNDGCIKKRVRGEGRRATQGVPDLRFTEEKMRSYWQHDPYDRL
jgi:hypothetical protein